MKKILIILLITLFNSSIFASDDKPGRFFEDQPDVTEEEKKDVLENTRYYQDNWKKYSKSIF